MHILNGILKPNIGKLAQSRDVKGLTKALSHRDWHIREEAVKALGRIKTTEAFDSLIKALNDKESSVRECVVESLGNYENTKVVQLLVEKLKDENLTVRKEAVKSIGKISGTERLIKLLKSKDKTVCQTVVEALGETKDPIVIQPLIKVLHHKDDDVRKKAAETLRVFDTEDAQKAIKAYEIQQHEARIRALDYIVGSPLAKQGYYSSQIGRESVGYFDPLKVVFRLFNNKGRRLGRGRKKIYDFVWPSDWGTDDVEAYQIVEAFEQQKGGSMLLIGDHAPYTANLLRAVQLVRALGIPRVYMQPFRFNLCSEIEQIVSKLETVSRGEVGKFIYETTVLPFFQRYSGEKEVLIIEDLAEEVSLNALFNFLCSEVIPHLTKYTNLNKFRGRATKRIIQLRRKGECVRSYEEEVRQIVTKKLSDLK